MLDEQQFPELSPLNFLSTFQALNLKLIVTQEHSRNFQVYYSASRGFSLA